MAKPVWESVLSEAIDPARARVYWDQLLDALPDGKLRRANKEQVSRLSTLFCGSQYLSELLLKHPDWYATVIASPDLTEAKTEAVLRNEFREFIEKNEDLKPDILLRTFQQRVMMHIGLRDLLHLTETPQIIAELSVLAEICLAQVLASVQTQMEQRLGKPYHQKEDGRWEPTEFSIIGLGKLGGIELNYSSDVDLLLVYSAEGKVFSTPPRRNETGKGISTHQYFNRLAKDFINEVTRLTEAGTLYRVDMRLRPEGDAGPLARSLDSYEIYYAQWGQIWERMMLLKARHVAGSRSLSSEFIEMVQPFRYPRSLHERILKEVAAMKDRIETEVLRTGESERNVKLGRGGIREIEFYVQCQQVLHGGKNPFLQSNQTLVALQNLLRYRLISRDEAADLSAAYIYLRDVEHRLQMENNLQTHTIPTDRKTRERLAKLMGHESVTIFETQLHQHTSEVRRIYEKLLKAEAKQVQALQLPKDFSLQVSEWKLLLAERSFHDVEKAFRLLQTFIDGPGYVHVSQRTSEMALELAYHFLAYCPAKPHAQHILALPPTDPARQQMVASDTLPISRTDRLLSDPDRVLVRLDSFITAYGARSTLYELWTHNPAYFELLLRLFDRSEFLAEVAIRTPDLLDDLALSGRLGVSKSPERILKELRYGLEDEDQMLWLRRYHQAEQLRIGLRDILGLADFEQNLGELSALADACLNYALEVVQKRHRLKEPPFAIIGLGKLGGSEINYGSDLDILYVAPDNTSDLAKLQKLAVEVSELLNTPTELGIAFHIDVRLRPDGEKGLLVNTLKAYEEYYRQRASLWELQAISRSRHIAGDTSLGHSFIKQASLWCDFSTLQPITKAWSPDWKKNIAAMRLRITKERTPSGQENLAIKTAEGGLMDAEFIAQVFCLQTGCHEPNTLNALLRASSISYLPAKLAEALIANYRNLRHIEAILRRWSFAGETLLPADANAFQRVSLRCGFPSSQDFATSITEYRKGIAAAYIAVIAT